MWPRFRQRWMLLARLMALGLLLLVVGIAPGLSSAAEVHELGHDPSGMHRVVQSDSTGATDPKPLHVVLDFAHCCNASVAIIPLGLDGVPVTQARPKPPASVAPDRPQTGSEPALRPPMGR